MAIVRNKKTTPSPETDAAIAAFGAAAEARPEETEPVTPAAPAARTRPASKPAGEGGPKSSLVRWEGNEDLRDAIIDYHRRERYPIHTVLLEAIRRGFEQMDSKD